MNGGRIPDHVKALPTREATEENRAKIKEHLKLSKNNINVPMILMEDLDIKTTLKVSHQILIQYKDESFELLPRSVSGTEIREFLGIKYPKIKSWGLLPAKKIHCARYIKTVDIYGQ